MATSEDKHRAEVHRLKAENHLKAAALLEGAEPAKSAAPIPAPSTPKPGSSADEIARFVAACAQRNRGL